MLEQNEIVRYGLDDATFMIPLRIESADRMRNIITTLIYLCRNFRTNISIHELDEESIFKSAVIPQLEQALIPEELAMVNHVFEKTTDYTFHRTRLLNDMAIAAQTKVVVNYDSDILLPQLSYIKAVDFILNGYVPEEGGKPEPVKCVYPYGFGEYQVQCTPTDESVSAFINSNFNYDAFEGQCRKWDAKYGFCQFFDREEYIRLGMENENFVSYGYEDDERYMRFNSLSNVIRYNGDILHLEHVRTSNSWFTNPHIEENRSLWERLRAMSKGKLSEYYDNVEYAKVRRQQALDNGQEQSSTEA